MPQQARVGRVLRLLLFASLCSIALGAAVAWRVDARQSTLRKLDESGELKSMSDRQVDEETQKAERVSAVVTIAKAVVGAPLRLGLSCLALIGVAWFLRGRVKAASVGPVAAATLLPGSIADLIDTASALRHAAIPPEGAPLAPRSLSELLVAVGQPLGAPWLRLGNALDFFSLWAAVMLAYGVAAAGQIPPRRALLATVVGWGCLRLLTQVAT